MSPSADFHTGRESKFLTRPGKLGPENDELFSYPPSKITIKLPTMKKILFMLFLVLSGWSSAQAQLRLNGYAGYNFDNSFDSRYSNTSYFYGLVKGGLMWGAGVEYLLGPDYGLELIYFRQDTEAPVNYYDDGDVSDIIDLGINYIMVGGVRYLEVGEVFEPYGGLMAGLGIYSNKNPKPGEPNSNTAFGWGVRLGSNIWFTESVGIKVQAQLLSAVQGVGGGFYFGTGGVGSSFRAYSTMYHFGLGGGLVISLGGE